tara:strand:- start:228 stop:434 length:207 start_codon:yes stop_codon:yes gene_type:complete
MTIYNYKNHDEIPDNISEYLLICSEQVSIIDIPLVDINSFLNGYEEYLDEERQKEFLNNYMYGAIKNV